jgi:hypothetical protein
MADPIKQAKSSVHLARNDRQEKAAAYWQQAINEGRVLRQARVEVTAGERQAPQQEAPQQRRGRAPQQAPS